MNSKCLQKATGQNPGGTGSGGRDKGGACGPGLRERALLLPAPADRSLRVSSLLGPPGPDQMMHAGAGEGQGPAGQARAGGGTVVAKIITGTWDFPLSRERFGDGRLSAPFCWRIRAGSRRRHCDDPPGPGGAGQEAPPHFVARLSCRPQTLGPAVCAGSRPRSAETGAPRPGRRSVAMRPPTLVHAEHRAPDLPGLSPSPLGSYAHPGSGLGTLAPLTAWELLCGGQEAPLRADPQPQLGSSGLGLRRGARMGLGHSQAGPQGPSSCNDPR